MELPPTEDDIVGRLRAGDESVLESLLRTFAPRLRFWLLRQNFGTRFNDEDLEDILAVTLFQAWINRGKYDPKRARLSTWLHVLAYHAAIDLLRERSRAAPHTVPLDGSTVPAARVPEAESPSPMGHDLSKAMKDSLSELEQDVLRARASAVDPGNWTADLCKRTGLTPGDIRTILFRARQKLTARLTQMGYQTLRSPGKE